MVTAGVMGAAMLRGTLRVGMGATLLLFSVFGWLSPLEAQESPIVALAASTAPAETLAGSQGAPNATPAPPAPAQEAPATAQASPAQAAENVWHVAKVSGEAWTVAEGNKPAALSRESILKAGDAIRTGRQGRVLLVRGAESILVSANSALSLPEPGRAGMSTVIQQAGSSLFDVEKRNVQHFEVETPYLAAVVKGTQFRVTVAGGRARVDVSRGQVQVADFKSGQVAQVLPGQSARVSRDGSSGLKLSGSGKLGAISQGTPQPSHVAPIRVPKGGLKPPGKLVKTATSNGKAPGGKHRNSNNQGSATGVTGGPGNLRLASPIGDVKLDIQKVTNGLAHGTDPTEAGPKSSKTSTDGSSGSKKTAVKTASKSEASPKPETKAATVAKAAVKVAAAKKASTTVVKSEGSSSKTSTNGSSGSKK